MSEHDLSQTNRRRLSYSLLTLAAVTLLSVRLNSRPFSYAVIALLWDAGYVKTGEAYRLWLRNAFGVAAYTSEIIQLVGRMLLLNAGESDGNRIATCIWAIQEAVSSFTWFGCAAILALAWPFNGNMWGQRLYKILGALIAIYCLVGTSRDLHHAFLTASQR